MTIKLKCPQCGRVLGDTTKSIDCTLNCRDHGAQHIAIKVADFGGIFKLNTPQEEQDDQSK